MAGLIDGLKDVLPGRPKVTLEGSTGGDGDRVEVRWNRSYKGASMTIFLRGDTVHFSSLDARGKGLYDELWKTLPRFFKEQGFAWFTAYPQTPESGEALLAKGNFEIDHGLRAAL